MAKQSKATQEAQTKFYKWYADKYYFGNPLPKGWGAKAQENARQAMEVGDACLVLYRTYGWNRHFKLFDGKVVKVTPKFLDVQTLDSTGQAYPTMRFYKHDGEKYGSKSRNSSSSYLLLQSTPEGKLLFEDWQRLVEQDKQAAHELKTQREYLMGRIYELDLDGLSKVRKFVGEHLLLQKIAEGKDAVKVLNQTEALEQMATDHRQVSVFTALQGQEGRIDGRLVYDFDNDEWCVLQHGYELPDGILCTFAAEQATHFSHDVGFIIVNEMELSLYACDLLRARAQQQPQEDK